jgi:hypothetical protein
MDDGESRIAQRCGLGSPGRSRKIACPGCRRQRHSAGAGECARAQRLGQRSQRHRQRGQGACDTAANHHSGDAARRIPFCGLPRAAGAARGKDQANAICGIEIAWLGGAGGGQRAGQAARPRGSKHLQGMLIPQASRRMNTTQGLAAVAGSRRGHQRAHVSGQRRAERFRIARQPALAMPEHGELRRQ